MGGVSVGSQSGCSGAGLSLEWSRAAFLVWIWQRWRRSPHAQELPPSLELLPDSGTAAIWPRLFLAHSPQLGTAEVVAQESFNGL